MSLSHGSRAFSLFLNSPLIHKQTRCLSPVTGALTYCFQHQMKDKHSSLRCSLYPLQQSGKLKRFGLKRHIEAGVMHPSTGATASVTGLMCSSRCPFFNIASSICPCCENLNIASFYLMGSKGLRVSRKGRTGDLIVKLHGSL